MLLQTHFKIKTRVYIYI